MILRTGVLANGCLFVFQNLTILVKWHAATMSPCNLVVRYTELNLSGNALCDQGQQFALSRLAGVGVGQVTNKQGTWYFGSLNSKGGCILVRFQHG